MSELFHWLLSVFLFQPLQAEIDRTLAAAQAPRAAIQQMQTCVSGAAPTLASKAAGDWVWGAKTVISVAAGLSDPLDVLATEAPSCRAAVDAVRPFLKNAERA
jgi:hypothetical protein